MCVRACVRACGVCVHVVCVHACGVCVRACVLTQSVGSDSVSR